MEFIPVQSFNTYIEAHIAMGYLQEQHINCWLKDEYTVTIDPLLTNAVGGIKLMVAKVQVPRAIELLKAVEGKEQHYSCPYCGSHDIQLINAPQKKEHWFITLLKILFGKNAATAKQIWHCATCGKDCHQLKEMHAETMENVR